MQRALLALLSITLLVQTPAPAQEGKFGAKVSGPPRQQLALALTERLASSAPWDRDGAAVVATVSTLLALTDEGHTTANGTHKQAVREGYRSLAAAFPREGGCALGSDPAQDIVVAEAAEFLGIVGYVDRVPAGRRLARLAALELVNRQAEDGLWGAPTERVEATAHALLALRGSIDVLPENEVENVEKAMHRAFKALDSQTDADSGTLRVAEGKDGEAASLGMLEATASVVTAKIMGGVDPASDPLLAKGMSTIKRTIAESPEELESLDAHGWEWLVLGAFQVEGKSESFGALAKRSAEACADDARALLEVEKWSSDQVQEAGSYVGLLSAPYRYGRVLGR